MTIPQFTGWAMLAVTLIIVVRRGQPLEKAGIAMIALAFLLTPLVERRDSWYAPQLGIMAVDVALLAGLTVIAFRYDRSWPICAAGFQSIAVMTHLVFLINPPLLYRAFYYVNFSIGYFVLGALIGGVLIECPSAFHLRRGQRALSVPWP
jgi:hypothetical protein